MTRKGTAPTSSDDQWGQLTRRTLPDDFDPSTLDYETFVNNYRGDVTSHTDFRGNTTTSAYNKRRQVTQISQPGSISTQYTYDNDGKLWKITDPNGNITETTYTATGKLLLTKLPALPGPVVPEIENHYDSRDWLEWNRKSTK